MAAEGGEILVVGVEDEVVAVLLLVAVVVAVEGAEVEEVAAEVPNILAMIVSNVQTAFNPNYPSMCPMTTKATTTTTTTMTMPWNQKSMWIYPTTPTMMTTFTNHHHPLPLPIIISSSIMLFVVTPTVSSATPPNSPYVGP